MDNSQFIISFKEVMLPLSAALGASVGVERILEVAQNALERMLGRKGTRQISGTAGADEQLSKLQYMLEITDTARAIDSDPGQQAAVLATVAPGKQRDVVAAGEWGEQHPLSRILVQEATDQDDGTALRTFVLHILGIAAGIVLARQFDIQLFHKFKLLDGGIAVAWDYILTGILIGGGSAPVHVLIRFLSERKLPVEAENAIAPKQETLEKAVTAVPEIITTPSAGVLDGWVDIPYTGGVDREVLENVHRRQDDPDMVIFHHTAMSSKCTFNDVVRVIKDRTDTKGNHWLTGYNCVIMADGSVNALCRWDRYGSHAVGYNQRSLGLAFNGNFETDPKVPFSNPTGKYGPSRPTEEQLKAGARVVALWTFLYPKIWIDFNKSIIPHNQISQKTCPGGMFPYDEFRKWIEFYRATWDQSTSVKDRIALFSRKPYLFHQKEA